MISAIIMCMPITPYVNRLLHSRNVWKATVSLLHSSNIIGL